MADKKITDMTAITGGDIDSLDLFTVVDVSANENKKMLYSELLSILLTDITGSLSIGTLSLVDNAVTNAKLRDSSGLSVIGNSTNSTGDPADIVAGSDGQVLRRDGTTLGFGQVALGAAAAVVGVLGVANGGTGQNTVTTGDIIYASNTNVLARLGIGSSDQYLGVASGLPSWRDLPTKSTGYAALGSNFNCTASYADTGLSLTLPSAGKYLLLGAIRGVVVGSGGNGFILAKFYNSTTAADVPDSEVLCAYTDSSLQATTAALAIVTVTGADTIKLYGKRAGSFTTWTTSAISGPTNGNTIIAYIKLSD